ncbi:hypothetical protein JCM8547_008179 [Rhodosporidiobolus lusitaniae]
MAPLAPSTTTARLTPIPLTSFATSPALPSSAVFRGRIASVRAYSPHTRLASFTLAPTDAMEPKDVCLEVELKGWWAEKASKRFRVGETVVLKTSGGKLLEGSAKGKEKEGGGKKRLRFDKGLTGWVVRKGGDEEVLRYKATDPRPIPSSTPPRPALTKPPRQPQQPTPAPPSRPADKSTRTASDEPQDPPAAPPKAVIPAKRRAPSPDYVNPAPPSKPARPSKVSEPGEGSRSVKRRKQQEKLGWGLTSLTGVCYSAFDKLADVLAGPSASSTSKKTVNLIAFVAEVGETNEPRRLGGDYYKRFQLVCPSDPAPVEVQWYSKTEAGIPEPEVGDVLALHNLALKSSSTLLAGSYDPIPHSVLSSPQLLDSAGPTQHPPPAPPLPPCPDGANAYSWRKKHFTGQPVGIPLDEEELKYAVRVAKYYAKKPLAAAVGGLNGAGALASTVRASGSAIPASVSAVKQETRRSLGAGAARPLMKVEELQEGHFCDLVGMVVGFYNASGVSIGSIPSNSFVKLTVTDYTSHPALFDYSASSSTFPDSGGLGLPGKLVLTVSLFGYQSEPLSALLSTFNPSHPGQSAIKRGALVHLRNLRVKVGDSGFLEATMVEEREEKYRWKRDVTVLQGGKVTDERWKDAMKGIQTRHREFWQKKSVDKQ